MCIRDRHKFVHGRALFGHIQALVLDVYKRQAQSGGFCQGGPIAGLNLTGIESISFDFAANTAEALTGPADVAFYLFSGSDYVGYQELNEVDTSKVMAFDVAAIRAGYGKGCLLYTSGI